MADKTLTKTLASSLPVSQVQLGSLELKPDLEPLSNSGSLRTTWSFKTWLLFSNNDMNDQEESKGLNFSHRDKTKSLDFLGIYILSLDCEHRLECWEII